MLEGSSRGRRQIILMHPEKHAAWLEALRSASLETWSLRRAGQSAFDAWKAAHEEGVKLFHSHPEKHAALEARAAGEEES